MQGFMAICAFGTKDRPAKRLAKVQCITFDHFILMTQNSTRLRNMHNQNVYAAKSFIKNTLLTHFILKMNIGSMTSQGNKAILDKLQNDEVIKCTLCYTLPAKTANTCAWISWVETQEWKHAKSCPNSYCTSWIQYVRWKQAYIYVIWPVLPRRPLPPQKIQGPSDKVKWLNFTFHQKTQGSKRYTKSSCKTCLQITDSHLNRESQIDLIVNTIFDRRVETLLYVPQIAMWKLQHDSDGGNIGCFHANDRPVERSLAVAAVKCSPTLVYASGRRLRFWNCKCKVKGPKWSRQQG